MVKLASARECRAYGPGRRCRNRWEYINAGLYLLASILLSGGLAAQLSAAPVDAKSGLAVALIGLSLLLAVNAHDLAAHVSGVDYCLALVEFDVQLALVEFAVPVLHIVGIILTFVGFFLIAIQMEEGYNSKLKIHALNTLIAGPIFWLIGSTQNICQVYQRASANVQVLQKCVQVPHLMGSLFFLVAGILNKHDVSGAIASPYSILGRNWVWLCLPGSVLFFVGGLWNVAKVFKMQQMTGVRLEKLRGCAHEMLAKDKKISFHQYWRIVEGRKMRRCLWWLLRHCLHRTRMPYLGSKVEALFNLWSNSCAVFD